MKPEFQMKFHSTIKQVSFVVISLCLWIQGSGQSNSSYSILVAGHAYGAHAGGNIGLHPPFLNKLSKNSDSSVAAVFLTGDIVNQSTNASWSKVENELSALGLISYYVMGNHDNNSVGIGVFTKKHGGLYYSFSMKNELYIVLNSTESDRSISTTQLKFLDEVLKNSGTIKKRVFIFFHEVIWNSHEKYKLVRSNSRSRYDQIVSVSNFWQKVFPLLTAYPEKNFFLFAGDVGGNPDAIAASYDRWGNVTLVSSGMGEVRDENYLKVNILPDTVAFTLIPLNDDVEMKSIKWYNVPEKPEQIQGPTKVNPPALYVRYEVSPVFNTTGYRWSLSNGISGTSKLAAIDLRFEENFQVGQIMARAVNDGFGESGPVELNVQSGSYTSVTNRESGTQFYILQNQQSILINYYSETSGIARLKIFDQLGKLLFNDEFGMNSGINTRIIDKNRLKKGFFLIELSAENKRHIQKTIIY